MACQGPDMEEAYAQAAEAEQRIMKLLEREYRLTPPCGPFSKIDDKDWMRGKKRLHEGLKDLFWCNACDKF